MWYLSLNYFSKFDATFPLSTFHPNIPIRNRYDILLQRLLSYFLFPEMILEIVNQFKKIMSFKWRTIFHHNWQEMKIASVQVVS